MQDYPERSGTESEWFVLADASRVAVFATAGVGPDLRGIGKKIRIRRRDF